MLSSMLEMTEEVRKKELHDKKQETMRYYGFGVLPAMQMKVCQSCGHISKATKSVCAECGARLPEQNLYQQSIEDAPKCPYCTTVLLGEEHYCPICGKLLQQTGEKQIIEEEMSNGIFGSSH